MSIAEAIMGKDKPDPDSDAADESAGEDNAELEVASSSLMSALKKNDPKAFASAFKDMLSACNDASSY